MKRRKKNEELRQDAFLMSYPSFQKTGNDNEKTKKDNASRSFYEKSILFSPIITHISIFPKIIFSGGSLVLSLNCTFFLLPFASLPKK